MNKLVAISLMLLISTTPLHAETVFDSSSKETMKSSFDAIKKELPPRKQELISAAFSRVLRKEAFAAAIEAARSSGKIDAEELTFERIGKLFGGKGAGYFLEEAQLMLYKDLESLEKRVSALEGEEKKPPKKELSVTTDTEAEVSESGGLTLGSVSYQYEKGEYGRSYYRIKYTIKNEGKKGIKLNKAYINFEDLLGDEIYGIKIEPDIEVPAMSEAVYEGRYRIKLYG